MIISDEIKVKITSKIKGIQEVSDWSIFDISSISDIIDITELDENNVKNERIVWENVAKLSIDLFLDYDYYKKFTFQNDFRGYDYDEKLRKLGFNEVDGFWLSERKPDKETVIRNVFLSCLYRSIELKMTSDGQNLCEQNQSDNECGTNGKNCGDIEDVWAAAANAIGIAGGDELTNCDAGQTNYGAINNGPTTSIENRINIEELGEIENARRMNDKFEIEENKINNDTKVGIENRISEDAQMEKGITINKNTKKENENNLMNGGDCALCGTEILAGEKECSTCGEPFLDGQFDVNSNEQSIDYSGKSNRPTKTEFLNVNPNYEEMTCDETNVNGELGMDFGSRGGFTPVENEIKINKYITIENENKYITIENENKYITIENENKINKYITIENENKYITIENENKINKCLTIENKNTINKYTMADAVNRISENWKIEKENNIKENAKKKNEKTIDKFEKIDNHLNRSPNMKKHLMSSQKEKWLCESCERLNSYQFHHCSICVKPRQEIGLWICMGCSFFNEMRFSNCQVCEAINELNNYKLESRENLFDYFIISEAKHSESQGKKPARKNDKSPKENFCRNTKYRCWNRDCNQFNDVTSKFCSKCSCKVLTETENASGPQELNHGRKDPEMGDQETWVCSKCTYINPYGNEQCLACNSKKGKIKKTIYEINERYADWQCWHKNCKQMNDCILAYCHACGLYRNDIAEDGDIVKCKNKSGIKDIWICASCSKFNDVLDRRCAGKNCRKDRFHKCYSRK